MKKILMIILLSVGVSFSGQAQIDSLLFADSLQIPIDPAVVRDLQWVDLDQNKQLDLLVIVEDGADLRLLRFVPDTDTILVDTTTVIPVSDQVIYHNIDHQFGLDIISYAADRLVIHFHEGDTAFTPQEWAFANLTIEDLQVVDFEQDGRQELVVNGVYEGEDALVLLRRSADGWTVERIRGAVDQFTIVRPEEVSPPVLLAFGTDSLYQYSAREEQLFRLDTTTSFNGIVSAVDVGYIDDNPDPDLALVMEENDTTRTYLFMNNSEFIELDTNAYHQLFIADFNSDGQADIYGENDEVKHVFINAGSSDAPVFDKQDLTDLAERTVTFGDFDFDGDLDLGAYNETDATISFESNVSGLNEAPSTVPYVLLFQGNKSIALYWPEATDDHSAILTYGLDIRTSDTAAYKSGVFDLGRNGERDRVGRGNMGAQRFGEFFDVPPGDYEILVQAIDRAFYAGSCFGFGFGLCDDVPEEFIAVCRGETLDFNNDGRPSHWYSSNRGYLGLTTQLSYLADQNDRLYTVAEDAAECDDYKVWEIVVEEFSEDLIEDFYGCEGNLATIDLTRFAGVIDSLSWTVTQGEEVLSLDSLLGTAAGSRELVISFTPATTVTFEVTVYAGACTVTDAATYRISVPEGEVTPREAAIDIGESIQLRATPGFEYLWSPPEGLSAINISDPVATPDRSMIYIVAMTDSIGCTVTDTTQITVRQFGFLPELFTPNNDGSNDRLVVHQLVAAENFLFKVFDKRGNIVFRTESVQELRAGWDGTFNGVNIPSGTYFWEVAGTNDEGIPIVINGEYRGIVNLVR